jgi:ABC-type bacteriocin/lantibiotic exporter with double-glycine peptidase domain
MSLLLQILDSVLTFFYPRGDIQSMRGIPPKKFKRSIQMDSYSCGAHATLMALHHFKQTDLTITDVKYMTQTDKQGTAEEPIISCLRSRGLTAFKLRRLTIPRMRVLLGRGHILITEVDGDHYCVVHGIDDEFVYLADPATLRVVARQAPLREFAARKDGSGIAVRR